jgi:hypothetical protein
MSVNYIAMQDTTPRQPPGGSNPPGSSLDITQRLGFLPFIISPCVSTPGARPPQGGLCYFLRS